ncbi:hypothetical protein B0J18DRAFT_427812, partial [Chaetomium sp. MPI-SDFR-AT-0129]
MNIALFLTCSPSTHPSSYPAASGQTFPLRSSASSQCNQPCFHPPLCDDMERLPPFRPIRPPTQPPEAKPSLSRSALVVHAANRVPLHPCAMIRESNVFRLSPGRSEQGPVLGSARIAIDVDSERDAAVESLGHCVIRHGAPVSVEIGLSCMCADSASADTDGHVGIGEVGIVLLKEGGSVQANVKMVNAWVVEILIRSWL